MEEVKGREPEPSLDELLEEDHLASLGGRGGFAGGRTPLDQLSGLEKAIAHQPKDLSFSGG